MAKAKATETGGKVNKTKLVEEAMDALGGDPGPKDIQDYIQQHHNLGLKYALVASYKSTIKNRRMKAAGGRRGPSGSVDMNDLTTVKDLLDRVGEARIFDMIQTIKALRK
ncbi:MAG: hypothetical protein ABGY75_11620 [Gemmataceae bacterium]